MDFHRLARRELQNLCKKNKIPANMTNVAMADALKALEIVEGIEEFLQPCKSETAQSSVESPVRSEVTSPHVPPTGGRSTRRRNVMKEEPESAKPMTRSRRTTRKTIVKDSDESQVDAIETPAAEARTKRKKAPLASARRKMDSQLKECVEKENKDAIVTPAPLGATSRRSAVKKESEVKRVYSTRRSARLAEKNIGLSKEVENENPGPLRKELFTNDRENVEMKLVENSDDTSPDKNIGLVKEVENENPGPLKKELFTKDHENVEMNSIENSDDLDEISGITGGDENTNVKENSEKKDEVEAVSAPKQDISLVSEGEMACTGEEEIGNNFEAGGSKPEVKEGSDVKIQEVEFGSETEAEFDDQKCDKTQDPKDENIVMPVDVQNEVQDSDGSHDFHTSEIEITVENKEEMNTDKDAEEYAVKAAEQKEDIDVFSAPKQDISLVSEGEGEMVCTGEEEIGSHFEAGASKPEVKEDSDVEIQEVGFGFETEAEFDEQKCDKTEDPRDENIVMPLDVQNEVQDSDGSHDARTSEIEITVENKEEMNTDKDAEEYEVKAAEQKEDIDVVSAPKQDTSLVCEGEMMCTGEEEIGNHFEAGGSKPEVKEDSDVEIQEVGFGFETEAEFDEQKCDKTEDPEDENIVMPLNVQDEVQNSDGSHDVHTSEIEITVGNNEEMYTDKDAEEYEVKAAEQKEDMDVVSVTSEGEMVSISEEEIGNHFEADVSKSEAKESSDVEIQEVGSGFETEAEFDEQKCDTTEDPEIQNIVMPMSNEVQEWSHDDLHTFEVEIRVEDKEELITDKDAEGEDETAECLENIVLESEAEEPSCDTDVSNEIEKEMYNDKGMGMDSEDVTDFNVNEEVSETKADVGEMEFNTDEFADFVISEATKEPTDAVHQATDDDDDSLGEMLSDISLTSEEDEAKMKLYVTNWNAVITELTEKHGPISPKDEISLVKDTDEPHEIGIIQPEEITISADSVISDSKEESADVTYQNTDDADISSVNQEDEAKMNVNITNWNTVIADLSDNQDPIGEKNETNFVKDTAESHEIEIVQHEEITKSADKVISDSKEESTDVMYQIADDADISSVNQEEEAKMKLNITNWKTVIADLSDNHDPIGEKDGTNFVKDTEEPHEIEIVQQDPIGEKDGMNFVKDTEEPHETEIVQQDPIGEKDGMNLVKDTEEPHEVEIVQHEESTKSADSLPTDTSICLQTHPVAGLDSHLITKPTSSTPRKSSASKASATKKRMTAAVSDNKENIGSGSKLVLLTKERVKTTKKTAENVQKYDNLSMRMLSKMLKEKLTITTNKENENENENEHSPVRPALQALPENR